MVELNFEYLTYYLEEKPWIFKIVVLAILAVIIALVDFKLFLSLLLIFFGCFLIYTFGRDVHNKPKNIVEIGVSLGFLLIIIGFVVYFA